MRKSLLTPEQFLSCMATGACIEVLLALFGVHFEPLGGDCLAASITGIIIGAILTIATTAYSAVSESAATEEAEGEARGLARRGRKEHRKRERIAAKTGRQELALEREKLASNKKIQAENEKARREQRRRAKSASALQHQQNIAGIAVPDQTGQEAVIQQEKQQMWGV